MYGDIHNLEALFMLEAFSVLEALFVLIKVMKAHMIQRSFSLTLILKKVRLVIVHIF